MTKYELIKILLIDKISTKIADEGLIYNSSNGSVIHPNYKTELLKLDTIEEILVYAEKV